jgi:hypothetical protein
MFFPVRLHLLSTCLVGGALFLLPCSAASAPVFSSTSAVPDAISPNLPIPDGVQDFTVISFTVLTDSADVRVSLRTAGGAVVDVLQPFARRGRGVHTLVFDGTIAAGNAADGDYLITVLGVDTGGAGSEQVDLPLLIDRVPPEVTVWELVSPPEPVLQNGITLTLHACVTGTPDTVFVDLSGLDSGFDPAQVVETPAPPDCRLYTYTITPANTVPDTLGPVALVTGRDRAGNGTTEPLDLCLSNHPPAIVSATLLSATPFFQNGDEIQAEIEVASPNRITAGGDFLNLDSGFDAGLVQFTDLGNQRFEVRYRISETNFREDGDYTLHLIARDQGCGEAADSSLVITLDNEGRFSSLLDNVSVDVPAFSPRGNGRKLVHVNFTVLEDSMTVIMSAVARLSNYTQPVDIFVQRPTVYNKGTYSTAWDGSSPVNTPANLLDQELEIDIRAISFSLGQQRTYSLPLEVDSTSPLLTAFPPPGSLETRNGQVLEVALRFDRDVVEEDLTADFSRVDSNFNPLVNRPSVLARGSGSYSLFYTVSATNTIPDSTGIPVPLTAVDRAGNTTVSDLVRVCLNNLPPQFVSSRFLGDAGPFRSGDRIVLETTWATEPTVYPLVVTADFSAIDDKYDPVTRPATVLNRGGGVFEISHTLTATSTIREGLHLPIRVTARDSSDAGCGRTPVEAAFIDLDSIRGPKPTLSAPAPVTGISTTLLTGTAGEAYDVIIERNEEPVDTFLVDPGDSTFLGTVSLDPGENIFVAQGRDLAGNLSEVSDPVNVFFAVNTTLHIPGRFGPGDEFFLAVLEPAGLVRVRIFNLEGIELRRLESPGGSIVRVPWNGEDQAGNLTSSGPCLAVVEIEDSGGNIRERLRNAFVFTRRRAGQ